MEDWGRGSKKTQLIEMKDMKVQTRGGGGQVCP